VAYHLLGRGARVTLVDVWGAGHPRSSSGGATRVIRGMYGQDRVYVDMVFRAFVLWRRFERDHGVKLYHRTGCLWMFAGNDEYARQSLPHLEAVGLRVESMPPVQVAQRYPAIDVTGIESAYFEEEAGYIDARNACRAVVDVCTERGGVYQQAAVRPGPISNERMSHVVFEGDVSVKADHYVFAVGPWLGDLFPDLVGPHVSVTRQEYFYFGTPFGDRRFEGGRLPVWLEMGDRIFYGVPEPAGRGMKVAEDTRGPAFDPTTGDRLPTPECMHRAREHLGKRFPDMAAAPLIETHVCQYANSPDGHFLLDRHPEARNVWLMGGGSGHAFKLAPVVGEQVAEAVLKDGDLAPQFRLSRLAEITSLHTQFRRER
jgi:glycine/D-amino acid oxidase-like deaminating enzyme